MRRLLHAATIGVALFAHAASAAACVRIGVLPLHDVVDEQRIWNALARSLDGICPAGGSPTFEVMDRAALDDAVVARRVDAIVTDPAHRGLLVRRSADRRAVKA